MCFDIKASREAGYSDDEIAKFLAEEFGLNFEAARKAGYSDTEIVAFFDEDAKAPKPPRPGSSAEVDELRKRMHALEAMLKALGTAVVASAKGQAPAGMSASDVENLMDKRLKDHKDAVMQHVKLATSISATLAAAARDGRRVVKHVGEIDYDKHDRITRFEITPVYKD